MFGKINNGNKRAVQIADYFIYLSKTEKPKPGAELTNLKLQKVLYYSQAWYLLQNEKALFDDRIEAWRYGPVVPTVYHIYKGYGDAPLQTKSIDSSFNILSDDDKNFLKSSWQDLKDRDAMSLVHSSHIEDPWLDAYRSDDCVITLESIFIYFAKFNGLRKQ